MPGGTELLIKAQGCLEALGLQGGDLSHLLRDHRTQKSDSQLANQGTSAQTLARLHPGAVHSGARKVSVHLWSRSHLGRTGAQETAVSTLSLFLAPCLPAHFAQYLGFKLKKKKKPSQGNCALMSWQPEHLWSTYCVHCGRQKCPRPNLGSLGSLTPQTEISQSTDRCTKSMPRKCPRTQYSHRAVLLPECSDTEG